MQLSFPWILSRKRLIALLLQMEFYLHFFITRFMSGALVFGLPSRQDWHCYCQFGL